MLNNIQIVSLSVRQGWDRFLSDPSSSGWRRFLSDQSSSRIKGLPVISCTRKFTLIAQYWLVRGKDLNVTEIGRIVSYTIKLQWISKSEQNMPNSWTLINFLSTQSTFWSINKKKTNYIYLWQAGTQSWDSLSQLDNTFEESLIMWTNSKQILNSVNS